MTFITDDKGILSTGNTTTTPLGSGATYTGTFEQNNYPDVGVSCQTDNDGTLYFDFSVDGTNVNTFPVNGFIITAGIHEFHTAVKLSRYFRVRLVNDVGAQSYLRLSTYYGEFRQGNTPPTQTISSDADTIIIREIYNPVDIARGNVQSITSFSKFGENSNVTTTSAPVTSSGFYRTPTAATALELVSSDTNDTSAGTGARKVIVIGLDSTWAEVTQEITMNGTTAVALGTNLIRVYRLYVSESGTYATQSAGSHIGTITLRESSAGPTWATIPLINTFPVGQSLIGAYTVPANKQFYLETLELSASTSKTASIMLFARANADDTAVPYTGAMRVLRYFDKVEGSFSVPLKGISIIQPKTDIGLIAFTNASTASVSVSFNGYLFDI